MEFNAKMILSSIVGDHPAMLMVLERLGIYPGFQELTIEEIGKQYGMNPKVITTLLNLHAHPFFNPEYRFQTDDIKTIINYLLNSHRFYVSEVYPAISGNIRQWADQSQRKELKMADTFFREYRNEVDRHFDYENKTVFPYITDLYDHLHQGGEPDKKNFAVSIYKKHHDDIEDKLDDLMNLLVKHLPADGFFSLRRKIILDLAYLEKDLNVHSRIENTILIPLVEEMEKNLNNHGATV